MPGRSHLELGIIAFPSLKDCARQLIAAQETVRAGSPVPNVFGMNFQSVSVGQKLAKSGLLDDPGLLGATLTRARRRALRWRCNSPMSMTRWAAWWPGCRRVGSPIRP